jgi:hypothetical protein
MTEAVEVLRGNVKVVSLTDGTSGQALGVVSLSHGLGRLGGDSVQNGLSLLCPDWLSPSDVGRITQITQVAPVPLPVCRSSDPYFVKFLLSEYWRRGDADTVVLYLDYDHVVRTPLRLPNVEPGTVLVSSEVHPLMEVDGADSLDRRVRLAFAELHHNTSFIMGTRTDLRRVASAWGAAYTNLMMVSHRYREELAFSLAAAQVGVSIFPVDLSVQSQWSAFQNCGSLFHYGGSTISASSAKRTLAAIERGLGPHCARDEIEAARMAFTSQIEACIAGAVRADGAANFASEWA